MPTLFSNFPFRRSAPKIFSLAACCIVIFAFAGPANAAIQDASSDDGSSWIFSTYGITIFLLVLLVGLVVYKKWRHKRDNDGFEDVELRRVTEPRSRSMQTISSGSQDPKTDRRAEAMDGVQVWEKPAEAEQSVFGAYRIDQEVDKLV